MLPAEPATSTGADGPCVCAGVACPATDGERERVNSVIPNATHTSAKKTSPPTTPTRISRRCVAAPEMDGDWDIRRLLASRNLLRQFAWADQHRDRCAAGRHGGLKAQVRHHHTNRTDG